MLCKVHLDPKYSVPLVRLRQCVDAPSIFFLLFAVQDVPRSKDAASKQLRIVPRGLFTLAEARTEEHTKEAFPCSQ